jgi:ankyrin repeat protein
MGMSLQFTPLMIAANEGYASIVEMLLQAGADATVENWRTGTLLEYAEYMEHSEVIKVLKSHGITK